MGRTAIGDVCLCLCALICLVLGQNNSINVAPNKSYSQSSRWVDQGPSSNGANDNMTADCIHTAGNNDLYPWWQVDLGRTFPLYSFTVWARVNHIARLRPFTITVDGQTCVSVTSMDSLQKTVSCSTIMYGQTVRITRQGTQSESTYQRLLNLCELQIWVPSEVSQCEAGRYGPSCTSQCSNNCGKGTPNNFCHQSDGHCYDGCVDGWYGDQCSTACSAGCQNTVCDRQTGHCDPCSAGYTGDRCEQCQDTYYKTSSDTCVPCSSTCLSPSCDRQTGKCSGCDDGRYGNQCGMTCPTASCVRCDQDTGICLQCAQNSNLQLPDCTDCVDGYYKLTLSANRCERCTWTCKSGTVCNQTGYCPSCPPGLRGGRCDEECQAGHYGEGCNQKCGFCQFITECRRDTGQCTGQCVKGYTGSYCIEVDTISDTVIIGSVVGAGLFIGICMVLSALIWVYVTRRRSREDGKTADEHSVTIPSPRAATPANTGQAAPFHGLQDGEQQYERVDDIPMSTRTIQSEPSATPDSTCNQSDQANPYNLPAAQYENTGDVKPYDPWLVSHTPQ